MKKCPVNLGKSVFCLLENLEHFQDTILAVTLQSLIYTLVTACNALLKFLRAFSDSKKFTFACCLVELIFELPYMHLKYALFIHIARMPCLPRIFPALKSGIE